MVLNDVPERARRVVVLAAPSAHTFTFRNGDSNAVHMSPVEQRFEDRVAETETEDVLNRFLSQIMIDPIDLFFGQNLPDLLIQFPGALEIPAERLFENHSDP